MQFKNILLATGILLLSATAATAQINWPKEDKSAMDQEYFPQGYPHLKLEDKPVDALRFRVTYSRPLKKGRTLFGSDIVPYGKIWRLGANEATELQFFTDVVIGGKKIHAGRYTLYALVNEKDWTFILNKETDIWGAYKYETNKDIVRVKVPVVKLATPVEALSVITEKTATGASLTFGWDTVSASLPINF